ncbi:hypothetical protein SCAR479_02790 [Seiridium cardinale]|uniref:Uncharacterized protein n=1 Tax=Seiridium cardinale TaxID=138064 RepID=A0ABR2Y240_9PEZI
MLVMVNSTALHCTVDGRSVASTGDSHEAVGIIGDLLSANLAGCGTDATGRLETCPAHKHWEKLGTSIALELSSSVPPPMASLEEFIATIRRLESTLLARVCIIIHQRSQ